MSDATSASIQTVFCATDFSQTAEWALEQGLKIVRRHGARLVLAHIVEPVPLGPYPILAAPQSDLVIRDLARDRIDDLAAKLREDGLTVDVRVDLGQPGPGLVAAAEAERADLIVIGTRGLTGFKHLALGSTAEYVVRRSVCPVLTIHPADRALGDPLETVIVPTDLSKNADGVTEAFVKLFPGAEKPHVILAYADRTPPYLEPFSHEALLRTHQRDVGKEQIEEKMEPSVERLRSAGFEVETAVIDGDPVTALVDLAQDRNVDLIMMSTHGRSALVNALMGRTAQRIVQHAPCPVVTVRPRG